jgi:hypothetical protein
LRRKFLVVLRFPITDGYPLAPASKMYSISSVPLTPLRFVRGSDRRLLRESLFPE